MPAVLVGVANSGYGQKVTNWRVYRAGDGMPETACASVTIGSHGRVIMKHVSQPFITRLDGYHAEQFPAADTNARKIYESPAGQLWAPTHTGLFEYKENRWELHEVGEIASTYGAAPQLLMVMPIRPVRQGVVMFLLPDALVEFNAREGAASSTEILQKAGATGLGSFTSLSLAKDGGLWVAGTRGIARTPGPARYLRPDAPWTVHIPPASLGLHRFQDPWELEDTSVTVLAESLENAQKVIVTFDGQRWNTEPVSADKVRFAWRSPDKTYWAVTPNSLYHWEAGAPELVESEEISARQYFEAAVTSSGAFWLATSDGLFRYAPSCWQQPPAVRGIDGVVHCVGGDARDRVWFATGTALHMIQNDVRREFALPAGLFRPGAPIRRLFALANGHLLLDSAGGQILFNPEDGSFEPLSQEGGEFDVLGKWKEGFVCLQRRESLRTTAPADSRLFLFNGTRWDAFQLSSIDGSPGTNFSSFFLAQNGDYWLGTEHGVAWFHENRWRSFSAVDDSAPGAPSMFVELSDGKIWCVAQDRLWEFDGQLWTELQRGFDRVNGIIRTRDGNVWLASNTGCFRYFTPEHHNQGAWVENGVPEGLPGEGVRGLHEDGRGGLWCATTHGLSLYHSKADPDAPEAFIQPLNQASGEVREGEPVSLNFGGIDKWKFTARDRLLFSYRLDQGEWTEFLDDTHRTYPDLPPGKHFFQVRAMDRNGNVNRVPAQLEFAVVVAWYKETRLLMILGAGVALALFFAALAFNRHLQLLRSYAEVERKVAERTRELEIANRELLHSQKMTALGTLSAGIAHDFNNILSIIKGSAQIIEQNPLDTGKVQTRVDRIKTVVEQGAGIVKAMLGFSRDSSQQTVLCDVNAVLEDTIRLLGDRFLRETRVVARPAPGLPQLVTAKDLVQQILLNFIFNAAESLATRREIIIATRFVDQLRPEVVLMPARAPGYVEISVQDFGCGISAQNLPRIFEPFFTTKAFSARRGTGLGLSMVYELAKKLEAGLAVQTLINEGSTFTLILPVRTEQAGSPEALER